MGTNDLYWNATLTPKFCRTNRNMIRLGSLYARAPNAI